MTSKIKVDNINKVSDDSNIINKCGTTITLGASGDSIALASGASQTGFGREGSVNWQTGSIKTTGFTAANGEGYFVDTSSGAVTATLPSSPSAGNIVAFADYTRTFGGNNLTIGRNSQPIGGVAEDAILSVSGQSATFVYVDGTEGWINVQETQTSQTGSVNFMSATGGNTVATVCTNFKVHTFTSPGTFCVSQVSNVDAARNIVAYTVVAGGGGGGSGCAAGGGGAGGFREGRCSSTVPYTASPLVTTGLTVGAQAFPITVGAGGTKGVYPSTQSTDGANSVFSTITSSGGGNGGGQVGYENGGDGGSGGGGSHTSGSAGTGNTPSVSPPQGQNGGAANPGSSPSGDDNAGSGGGAGATGAGGGGYSCGGGNGVATSITGSSVTRAGGGGGGDRNGPQSGNPGIHPGGSGGGGNSGGGTSYPRPASDAAGQNGTDNTGGGGGGGVRISPSGSPGRGDGGLGGSGVVIIRYRFQ